MRLDKQLAHDRWMREVEELRSMVDEAATTGLRAGNLIHVFRGQARWIVEGDGMPNDLYATKLRDAQEAVARIQGFVERFELRLGHGHELPKAFSAWQRVLEEALEWFETQPPNKDVLKSGGERLTASAARYLDFIRAARQYVKLEPPA